MKRFAGLALFLSSCIWDPHVHEVPAPEGERVAIEIARMHFERQHGSLPLHTGEIIWTDEECIYVDEDHCVSGCHYTYNNNIYLTTYIEIWQSSLVHELGHYWLDMLGDSDHDHERSDWWDMVPDINGHIKSWERIK